MDVLLYSKYSDASKKMMTQLQKTPDLLNSLTMTCIDNKTIRKQIISDQKIKVNLLPCIVRLNETTNNFDVFEGQNAFDFVTTLQQQIIDLEQRVEEEREQKNREQKMYEKEMELKMKEQELERKMKEKEKEKKEKVEEKTEKDILNARRQEAERHQSQIKLEEFKNPVKSKISTSIQSEPIKFTPIDDLDLEEESGINTYMHIEKVPTTEEREKSELPIKTGTSLLSKAMQMQKERN